MEARRSYGILCMLDAVCWALAVALLLVGGVTGVIAALIGASEALTPSPTGERDGRIAVGALIAAVVGAVALSLLTVVLDMVVSVMSLRRLDGSRGPRATPILSLVGVGISTALPLVLCGLALAAGALEFSQFAAALWWMLLGTVLALAPCARLAQLIGGLLSAATASRSASVGTLP